MSDLAQLTILEAKEGLAKKQFSSVELTSACLDSIKEQDSELHAFVTVLSKDALETAKTADQELKSGSTKPLLGIPLSLKDNFLTKNQRTTASSKVLDNFIPQFDATVAPIPAVPFDNLLHSQALQELNLPMAASVATVLSLWRPRLTLQAHLPRPSKILPSF